MLKIKQLEKKFYQGESTIWALKDINMAINKGDRLAVLGPSGSGKTTLLSLVAGLESPSNGEIYFENQNITHLSEKEWASFRASNIGFVFQRFHLMPHLTAVENVALPLEILGMPNPLKRASEVLEQFNMGERLKHLPSQLSGGECQRVAIARAFITNPPLLLADEPSGNLDLDTGKLVMDLLFSTAEEKKTSIILVTHDLKLATRCQNMVKLSGGRIVQ